MTTWNWRKAARVARWEFTKTIRSPLFLILTFLIPLIMVVVGSVGFIAERMSEERGARVLVVDEAGVWPTVSEHMVPGPVEFTPVDTRDQGERLLAAGGYDGLLILDRDALAQGRLPYYVQDMRQAGDAGMVRRVLEGPITVFRLGEMGLDEAQIRAAVAGFALDVRTADLEEQPTIARLMLPMVSVMILIMSTVLSGQILMYGVLKEKRNRIVEILLSSVSSLELITGKIAGFGLLSLIQIAIWVTAGLVVATRFISLADLQVGVMDLLPSLVFFLLGYLLLAALFAAVGATMKDAEGGSQAHGLVIMVPMIPMFLIGIIVTNPDLWWVRVLSHLPPFSPMTMLIRLGTGTIPAWEIATSIISLVLSVGLFVFLGARIFEGAILQYDRTLNLRDLRLILRGRAR